jgi:hypothetical protein
MQLLEILETVLQEVSNGKQLNSLLIYQWMQRFARAKYLKTLNRKPASAINFTNKNAYKTKLSRYANIWSPQQPHFWFRMD